MFHQFHPSKRVWHGFTHPFRFLNTPLFRLFRTRDEATEFTALLALRSWRPVASAEGGEEVDSLHSGLIGLSSTEGIPGERAERGASGVVGEVLRNSLNGFDLVIQLFKVETSPWSIQFRNPSACEMPI